MRVEKARFIRGIIEKAEALSAMQPDVKNLIPEDGYFEYGIVLTNYIRHTLASFFKNQELPTDQEQLAALKYKLTKTIDQIVTTKLLVANPVIPISYREIFTQDNDIAEILRLEKISWYPGITSSARSKGHYVPVYNTASKTIKEAFDYQLKLSLHDCIKQVLTTSYAQPLKKTTLSSSKRILQYLPEVQAGLMA